MKKIILLPIILILFVVCIRAEFWACFGKGQVVDFCNPKTQDRTCAGTTCKYCMSVYDDVNSCYLQGNYVQCNGISQQQCATGLGGGGGIDAVAPNATINSPAESAVYITRTVPFDIDVDERSDIYYRDNVHRPNRWTRLCNDCLDYQRSRSLKEGFNNLTFRFSDVIDNTNFQHVTFFLDSKRPSMRRSSPQSGFADGNFNVQFSEDNPKSLLLQFGNALKGYDSQEVDVANECTVNRGRYYCETNANIDSYDGQLMEYWFELQDIASNSAHSKHVFVDVDRTYPQITHFDYTVNGKYVYFNISVDELNMGKVTYIDWTDRRPRDRSLCSRLRGDTCTKKKSFKRGVHNISVQVTDKAGNAVAQPASFIIDY